MDRIQAARSNYQPTSATASKAPPKPAKTPVKNIPQTEIATKDSTSGDFLSPIGTAKGSVPLDFGLSFSQDPLSNSFELPPESSAQNHDLTDEIKTTSYDASKDGIIFGEHDPRRKQRLNLFAPGLSETTPLISIEARLPSQQDMDRARAQSASSFGNDYSIPVGAPKIRSPYLKQMGKNAANNLIKDPLKNAWENKALTFEAGRGIAIAGALAAGAIAAPIDTKFSTRLAKTEISGYDMSLKAGLKAGHGKLEPRSIGLSAKPKEQEDNTHERYDLKYDIEDSRASFSYSRTVDYGGDDWNKKLGHFEASVYHEEERNNTGFQLNYRLNW